MTKEKIFQAYVLRVLDIQYIVMGIIYLFYKEWFMGIFLITTSFAFGLLGQGLKHNKEKSAIDLLKGHDFGDDKIVIEESYYQLTQEEGRAFGITFIVLLITTLIILFHHDFHFYSAIPFAILIAFIYPWVLLYMGRVITKSIQNKK